MAHAYQEEHVVFLAGGRSMQTDLMSAVEVFLEDISSSAGRRAPPEIPELYSTNMSVDTKIKKTC